MTVKSINGAAVVAVANVPQCQLPWNISVSPEFQKAQLTGKNLITKNTLSPLCAANLKNTSGICDTLRAVDALFEFNLPFYQKQLIADMRLDDLKIQRLKTQAFATQINVLVQSYFGQGWFSQLICWIPSKIFELRRDLTEESTNRLIWLITIQALEDKRLHDSLKLINGRLNTIVDSTFIDEMLDMGASLDSHTSEFVQLRKVHDVMFPDEPPVHSRYKKLYIKMGKALVLEKKDGWKERLEMLREVFEKIEFSNEDLILDNRSVEEIIDSE